MLTLRLVSSRVSRGVRTVGGKIMGGCNLEILVQLLDKKLNLNEKLEVFDHLDRCRDCREAIYIISRQRDKTFFIYRRHRINLSVA